MKRYDEKLKESEEENAQLRFQCSEKFNKLSREVEFLKEKNTNVEMESELLRERSRRTEKEIHLLKEKNMNLETVMKKMKILDEGNEKVPTRACVNAIVHGQVQVQSKSCISYVSS